MQRESAILTLSDMHFGKKTSTFDPGVFEKRLEKASESMGRIRELLKAYQFDELVVCGLGDWNDGTDIYATQTHHQALSNVEQQADELSDHMIPFLQEQKKIWKKVRVEAVPGNHGRTRFGHESANWDIACYRYLQLKLKGVVPINFNKDNEPFIRKINVRGHHYLLYHGHEIRSFSNIPWYGMMIRMSRWLSTRLAPFDVALLGHFHTHGYWRINNIRLMLSGTFVTDDEWALQCLGYESATQMWLFGVSDRFPVTWQYGLEVGT